MKKTKKKTITIRKSSSSSSAAKKVHFVNVDDSNDCETDSMLSLVDEQLDQQTYQVDADAKNDSEMRLNDCEPSDQCR